MGDCAALNPRVSCLPSFIYILALQSRMLFKVIVIYIYI